MFVVQFERVHSSVPLHLFPPHDSTSLHIPLTSAQFFSLACTSSSFPKLLFIFTPPHSISTHLPHISNTSHSSVYPDTVGKGRCQRSGSCVPVSNTPVVVQQEQLRRPSRLCEDQMAIPQELKEQEWFQAGIPRFTPLALLSC